MITALLAAAALTTSLPLSDSQPAWSPDGRRVAFVRTTPQGSQIYVVRADGTRLRRLVRGEYVSGPAWSPDGRRLAYVLSRVEADGRRYVPTYLVVARADGTQRRVVYTDPYMALDRPAWSPDGTRIAVGTAGGIRVIDPATRRTRRVGGGRLPAWSPYGGEIVTGGCILYAYDAATGVRLRPAVTIGCIPERHATAPAWSPDGASIAFTLTLDQGATCEIMRTGRALWPQSEWVSLGPGQEPAWSPNGRTIAFSTCGGGPSRLYLMSADGTGRRPLLSRVRRGGGG